MQPQTDNESGSSDKVFIYSPFEKRENIIKWVKSETNKISLTFQNPLEASLKIHHVSLIVDGDGAPFVTPVSFNLGMYDILNIQLSLSTKG